MDQPSSFVWVCKRLPIASSVPGSASPNQHLKEQICADLILKCTTRSGPRARRSRPEALTFFLLLLTVEFFGRHAYEPMCV